MSTKTLKAAAVTGILTIAAVSAYWHWSPYLAIRQLQTAAQQKDADAFNDRVDYPKLRESFKGQFSAMMSDKLSETQSSGNGFAALGAMMGMAMADRMIDAMVRPETMMRAMQSGSLSPKDKGPVEGSASSDAGAGPPSDAGSSSKTKPKWAYDRKGADKLVAYAVDPEKPDVNNTERFGVVFQRSGFADWKLTEIRLPAMNK